MSAYRKDKEYFGELLNFFCFVNNETIPMWFGNTSEDRFYTILRRVGSTCECDYFANGVACGSGNFLKDDEVDIIFCEDE